MTSSWICSPLPPPNWSEICRAHGSLFHSVEWQSLLANAFGSSPLYCWNSRVNIFLAVTVFRIGPFRIGYIGFPSSRIIGGNELELEDMKKLYRIILAGKVHLLRLTLNIQNSPVTPSFPFSVSLETEIQDLQNWNHSYLPSSVRRNIRRAMNSRVHISDSAGMAIEPKIYALYYDTIHRHGGSLRYNAAYFHNIIEFSQSHARLRCLVATVDDEVAGFLVLALENQTAYYLHGGTDMHKQQYRPSDFLFSTAINWARENGMKRFNMMSSPGSQLGLVRYKEKWGGVTRELRTYDICTNRLQAFLFRSALGIDRKLRWFYSNFKSSCS